MSQLGSGASSKLEEPALEDSSSLSARQKALGLQLIKGRVTRLPAQHELCLENTRSTATMVASLPAPLTQGRGG